MFNLRKNLIVTTALVFYISASSPAATLHVPQDYKTIQAAIEAANTGDIVVVSAGTYKERIVLKPGITLKSDGDNAKGRLGLKRAAMTIIDGGGKEGKALASLWLRVRRLMVLP